MQDLKYVVIRIKYTGRENIKGRYTRSEAGQMQEFPIIFPKGLNHNQVADVNLSNRDIWDNEPEIVAAGFCNVSSGKWECFGHSESLQMDGCEGYKSRGDVDAALITDWNRSFGLLPKEE